MNGASLSIYLNSIMQDNNEDTYCYGLDKALTVIVVNH